MIKNDITGINKVFVGNVNVSKIFIGETKIFPSGEKPVPPEPEVNYLTFTAKEQNSTLEFNPGGEGDFPGIELEYNINDSQWKKYEFFGANHIIKLSNIEDNVKFRAGEKGNVRFGYFENYNWAWHSFTMTGKIAASGSVNTLLDRKDNVPDLSGRDWCFWQLFAGCDSLVSAPELPATTLGYECYNYMFSGCTSLTTAPKLPATTLADSCYYGMFEGCTSLTTAPELPATTLVTQCYHRMFNGCSNLNSVSVKFENWDDGAKATENWLNGVSSTGTFKCPDGLDTTTRDTSHIPQEWTIPNMPPEKPQQTAYKISGISNEWITNAHILDVSDVYTQCPLEETPEWAKYPSGGGKAVEIYKSSKQYPDPDNTLMENWWLVVFDSGEMVLSSDSVYAYQDVIPVYAEVQLVDGKIPEGVVSCRYVYFTTLDGSNTITIEKVL